MIMSDYCTKIFINDSVRMDLFTPSSFRVREVARTELFDKKYEIPFAVGHTEPWEKVDFAEEEKDGVKTITTDKIIIKIRTGRYTRDSVLIFDKSGRRLYPVDEPKYGMFVNKCVVFDSASFFREYNRCSRYAHKFYNLQTGLYDINLEEDEIYDTFFVCGDTYKKAYALFSELVGREPMLPKKGYGFYQTQHLSAEGTQELFMRVAKLLRERDIPCDTLILDYEWGDGADGGEEKDWGSRLEWSSEYTKPLPPREMLAELKKMNFAVMAIHHSAPDYEGRFDEDWLNNPCDSKLWWDKMHALIDEGIAGTWQDTRQTDVTDSHIYTGLQNYTGKRVWFMGDYDMYNNCSWTSESVLTPAMQRIGARRTPFRWTGDMSFDNWEELKFQIKAITNTEGALKGVSYLTNDCMRLGGRDISVRSAQFLSLNSVARSHNPKPWESSSADEFARNIAIEQNGSKKRRCSSDDKLLGLENEDKVAESIIRKYLKIRYSLIPYIYTAARETYDKGLPITRPLMVEFEDDENCNKNQYPRQYMLGNDVLVCPVYSPEQQMQVYLPDGCDWVEFESGKLLKGGREITVDVSDVSVMPMYVRSGAVITMGEDKNFISNDNGRPLTLNIFGNGEDSCILYEDDGVSLGYAHGECAFTRIDCQSMENEIKLVIYPTQGVYKGKPAVREFIIKRGGNSRKITVNADEKFEGCFNI